jgi:hypothetical protein
MLTTDQFFTLWDAAVAAHGPALGFTYQDRATGLMASNAIRLKINGLVCCPIVAVAHQAGVFPLNPTNRLDFNAAMRLLDMHQAEARAIARAADNIETGPGPLHIRARLLRSTTP